MVKYFLVKIFIILLGLFIFTIVELLMIKSATINEYELNFYKDKDGLIPVPRTFTKYTVKDYYKEYESIANSIIYVINIIFIIVTIKVLFFESISIKIYSHIENLILIIFIILLFIVICIATINIFLNIKKYGIEHSLKNDSKFENKLVKKYVSIAKKVSKIDSIEIANNKLWVQFFINKIFTIMLILILFSIRLLTIIIIYYNLI